MSEWRKEVGKEKIIKYLITSSSNSKSPFKDPKLFNSPLHLPSCTLLEKLKPTYKLLTHYYLYYMYLEWGNCRLHPGTTGIIIVLLLLQRAIFSSPASISFPLPLLHLIFDLLPVLSLDHQHHIWLINLQLYLYILIYKVSLAFSSSQSKSEVGGINK